jgi:cell wall assembly regulator SMI1
VAKKTLPTVSNAWQRIEVWCQKHLPELLDNLNPGATPSAIRAFEKVIGQTLPADLSESYAIHNGQSHEGQPTGLIFGVPILPLSLVQSQWEMWRQHESLNEELKDSMKSVPIGAIQLDYANRGWIPLTFDWSGNHIGVDLAPGPKGTEGQVITFGRDEDQKYVVARSWAEFLNDFANQLEAGNFKIDEKRQLKIKNPPVKHYHEAIAAKYQKRKHTGIRRLGTGDS